MRHRRLVHWRVATVISVAIFLTWALCGHRFGLNDEKYFRWQWRSDLPSKPLYFYALLSAVPFFLGQWLFQRRQESTWLALVLVTASMFGLMLMYTMLQPSYGTAGNRISDIVMNPVESGYFRDAEWFSDAGWSARRMLAEYPRLQSQLTGHVALKPPGPLLFDFALIRMFGASTGCAEISGILIGLIAALAAPATYLLVRHFTKQRQAAFFGASYLALCPSMLFFPQFDQCYVVLAVGLTVTWAAALERNRLACAVACGLLGGLTSFFTYLPMVLVFFLAGYAIWEWRRDPSRRKARILLFAAAAAAGLIAFYAAIWMAAGFDPLRTFQKAMEMQHQALANWRQAVGFPDRRLPGTIPWDLYGFAMGSGWIGFILAAFYFARAKENRMRDLRVLAISLLCIGQFLFVAVTGLIQSETARVWIFMQPMLMLPIGLELASWSPRWRLAVYGALLLLTSAMCQNLVFAL
ncbi:MAG: hypothetical protein ABSC42_00745 [Tepidisphaeraceae bacterium]